MKRTPVEAWLREFIGLPPGGDLRQTLETRRLEALRQTLTLAGEKSPFYREKLEGLGPEDICRQEDLHRLPFTTAEDIVRRGTEMICVPQDEIARIVTLPTSGSTGKPKRLFFTAEDQERTVDFFHHGMTTMTEPGDRVLILMPGDRPGSVGDLLSRGLARFGAAGLVHGPVTSPAEVWDRMLKEKPAVIVALPRQAAALVKYGLHKGFSPPPVRNLLLSADYVPESLARFISERWGCRVHEHYGMTETCLGGGVTCDALEGYHTREADLWFEVVDPFSGVPLPDGKTGEIVVTTLTRRGMPLIRYRTGDIGRWITGTCPCGSDLPRLDRVRGRYANIFHLADGGVLTGAALDDTLLGRPEVIDYDTDIAGEPGREILRLQIRGFSSETSGLREAVKPLLGTGPFRAVADIRCTRVDDAFFSGTPKGIFTDRRPGTEECLRLLDRYNHNPDIKIHCRAVAAGGVSLAAELMKKGYSLDTRFIVTAGLLHDIAKGSPNHDHEGARIAGSHGYTREAEFIRGHSNYDPRRSGFLSEGALLYLADMLLEGERTRDLEERQRETLLAYPSEDAAVNINRRFANARAIEQAFGEATGREPRSILGELLGERVHEKEPEIHLPYPAW